MKSYHDSTLKFFFLDPFNASCRLTFLCGSPEGIYYESKVDLEAVTEVTTVYLEEIFKEDGGVSSMTIAEIEGGHFLETYGTQGWKITIKAEKVSVSDRVIEANEQLDLLHQRL